MSDQTVKLSRPGDPISAPELDAVMAMASHSGWKPSRWHDGEPHFDSPFGDDDLRVLFVVARVLGAQCVPGGAVAASAPWPRPAARRAAKPMAAQPSHASAPLLLVRYVAILVAVLGTLANHPVAAGRAAVVVVAASYGLSRKRSRLTR